MFSFILMKRKVWYIVFGKSTEESDFIVEISAFIVCQVFSADIEFVPLYRACNLTAALHACYTTDSQTEFLPLLVCYPANNVIGGIIWIRILSVVLNLSSRV